MCADNALLGTRSSSASAARSGGGGIAAGSALPTCFTYALIETQPASSCEQVEYGNCVLRDNCTETDENTVRVSAGTVSLSSSSPPLDLDIAPDDSGLYARAELNAGLVGGEELNVEASGAAVPAFSVELTVPKLLVIDQPGADATGLIKVPATDNLVVYFSRGADRVSLELVGGSSTKTLSCSAPSSASTLLVPSAALAAIGSGAELKAYTVSAQSAPIREWDVKVASVTDAITPDHKAAITIRVE